MQPKAFLGSYPHDDKHCYGPPVPVPEDMQGMSRDAQRLALGDLPMSATNEDIEQWLDYELGPCTNT